MTHVRLVLAENSILRKAATAVAEAAVTFESRWTLAALKRVDADLHRRLLEQRDLYDAAMVTGSYDEIETQGAAMARGYYAVARAMEAASEADDAYMIGRDPRSGFTVAIGEQKAAADRVRQLHGATVVWTTPDEVAAIFANIEAFKPIAAIKRMFPGAEIVDVRRVIRRRRMGMWGDRGVCPLNFLVACRAAIVPLDHPTNCPDLWPQDRPENLQSVAGPWLDTSGPTSG
jgi:hypothetical protein